MKPSSHQLDVLGNLADGVKDKGPWHVRWDPGRFKHKVMNHWRDEHVADAFDPDVADYLAALSPDVVTSVLLALAQAWEERDELQARLDNARACLAKQVLEETS